MNRPWATRLPAAGRAGLLDYRVLIVLLLAPSVSFGQTAVNYTEKLTVEDGLSGQLITDVAQDGRGFLWIATTYGLNRYDGSEIVQFLNDGTEGCLPDNGVNCLLPVGPDRLLMGTNHGIGVLDLNDFTFHTVHPAPNRTRSSDQVQHLARDAHGQYWACTPTSIYRLDSNLAVIDVFRTQNDPMSSRNWNVYKVIPLPTGETAFWTHDGSYYWSPEGKGLLPLGTGKGKLFRFLQGSPYNAVGLVANNYLVNLSGGELGVFDLANGRSFSFPVHHPHGAATICGIWGNSIATNLKKDGVSVYTLESNGPDLAMHERMAGLLPGNFVAKAMEDDGANLWVATDINGLYKIASNKQLFFHGQLNNAATGDEIIAEISTIFPLGRTVLAGTFGEGFLQLDPVTGAQQQYSVRLDANSENMVWNFRHAGGDTLLIGTQQGLVYHTMGKHRTGRLPIPHPRLLDSVPITTLFMDSRHWLWMGLGRGNGLAVYDSGRDTFRLFPYEHGKYPFRYPLQAGEDAQGNLWFTSDVTGDLVRWDHRSGRFSKVIVPGVDGEIHFQTGGFYMDKKKNEIWYGLQPMGLVQYRIGPGSSTVYGVKNGLSSGMITGITKDKQDRLWLGTTQGITCFNPAKGTVLNYTGEDGLPASYYTSQLYYDSTLNRIYAGSLGVLTWFTVPDKLVEDRPMRIYLTDLKINGRSAKYPLDGQLELGPDQNNLYVKFSAINLSDGNKNRYQYRLNEDEWTNMGKQCEIRLASLNPGAYALEVRAAHKQGQFGPGHTLLHVSIHPFFTDTFWFYLICLAAATLLIYAWYSYRLGNMRKMEAMRARISRDLHDEIGSRLTNINMMSQIIRLDPLRQKEESLLGKIQEESEEISRSMREIIWDIDPQNDHLGAAMPRMLSFASQLLEPKNIEIQAHIDELDDLKLDMAMRRDLFLIFKEAVHNIAKHSAATKTVIRASVRDGRFLLHIEDNGRGLGQRPNYHESGLRYMKQRAKSHGWDLEITGLSPGTAIMLFIPGKA